MDPASLRRIRESAELDLSAYTALFFPNLGNARARA